MADLMTPFVREWLCAFSQRVRHLATVSLPAWGTDLDTIVRLAGADHNQCELRVNDCHQWG